MAVAGAFLREDMPALVAMLGRALLKEVEFFCMTQVLGRIEATATATAIATALGGPFMATAND